MSDTQLFLFGTAVVLSTLFVHELGHLMAARHFGVRVMNISMGLGPEIVGVIDRFGTRWSLGAIPLGASLKMVDVKRSSARASTLAKTQICDLSQSLSSLSRPQRAAIFLAGPLSNLLVAAIIYIPSQLYYEGSLEWRNEVRPDFAIILIGCFFNLSVAIYNLLPIPPLDGSKLVLLFFEWITEKE
jgi:RIP metalloprotease RseP